MQSNNVFFFKIGSDRRIKQSEAFRLQKLFKFLSAEQNLYLTVVSFPNSLLKVHCSKFFDRLLLRQTSTDNLALFTQNKIAEYMSHLTSRMIIHQQII